MKKQEPHIVGIGGGARADSVSERLLEKALVSARNAGARITCFGTDSLVALPHYLTDESRESEIAKLFVETVRTADGLIISSPGYHGTVSGLIKNAVDYLEETARDKRPYLEGLPVGLIGTAYGCQASAGALAALRSIVHSLRGWPTPFGATIKSYTGMFNKDGHLAELATAEKLDLIGQQVVDFARSQMESKIIRGQASRSMDYVF